MIIKGIGKATYEDGLSINTRFNFSLDQKNLFNRPKLLIEATSYKRSNLSSLSDLPFFPWSIIGRTTKKIEFTSEGLALISRGPELKTGRMSLTFAPNIVRIGKEDEDFDYIEFYYPNVIIGFDELIMNTLVD